MDEEIKRPQLKNLNEEESSSKKIRLGAATLITDSKHRLLLGRRGKEPNYGKWVIPGGGVKFGEKYKDAAKREVLEETGLQVELWDLVRPSVHEIIVGDEHRVILVSVGTAEGQPKASSDLLEARFFAINEIPVDDLSPAVLPILRAYGWILSDPDDYDCEF